MRRSAVVALVIAACLPKPALAQATAPAASKFAPMAFLAGSCWKGTFPGKTVTDEHCFDWEYGGNFLRDRHVVRGDSVPYEGQTTYAWNPQQKRIVYWYIALPGFYSTGYVQALDSTTLLFVDDLQEAAGKRNLRTIWKRTSPTSYSNRTEDVTGPTPKEMWSMEMRRSRPAPKRP